MAARPLKSISYDQPTLVTNEKSGKTWAILAPNLDGNYGYKLNTFRGNFKSITGAKDGDGNLFLIGNFGNAGGGETFDLNLGYKDGKKVEDKNLLQDLDKKWTLDLMPIICKAEGINSFEILAEVAHELSVILIDQNIETQQFFLVSIDSKDVVKSQLLELCALWITAYNDNPKEPYSHPVHGAKILELGEALGHLGMFFVPLCDLTNDKRLEDITIQAGGTRFKPEIKLALPPIKGEEICPYSALDVELPTIKKKGNWSNAKSETTQEKIDQRVKFLQQHFPSSSVSELVEAIHKDKSSMGLFETLIKIMG